MTAPRLIAPAAAPARRRARVLPAARAVGARRTGSRHAGTARRPRCVGPRTASRRRWPAWSARSTATCWSWSPRPPRAGRGTASPGAGELIEWEPVLDRAGVGVSPCGSRRRTWSWPCSCGRSRGSTATARFEAEPDRSSLWAGLFDLRENLLGRASTISARSPPRPRLDGRRLRQPRPRRALRTAAPAGRDRHRRDVRAAPGRQGREPGSGGGSPRGGGALRRLRRRDGSRTRRSRGCATQAWSSPWGWPTSRPEWR